MEPPAIAGTSLPSSDLRVRDFHREAILPETPSPVTRTAKQLERITRKLKHSSRAQLERALTRMIEREAHHSPLSVTRLSQQVASWPSVEHDKKDSEDHTDITGDEKSDQLTTNAVECSPACSTKDSQSVSESDIEASTLPSNGHHTTAAQTSADSMSLDNPLADIGRMLMTYDPQEAQIAWREHKVLHSDVIYKSGPLSTHERKVVNTLVQDYLRKNDIAYPHFVANVQKAQRDKEFWSYFVYALLYRKPYAIRVYMIRTFTDRKSGPLTTEEKAQLQDLVAMHGRKWASIGNLMNRHSDQIKAIYDLIQDSKATDDDIELAIGPWDSDEERRFQEALDSNEGAMIDFHRVACAVKSRSKKQCADHARARHRTDRTYTPRGERRAGIKRQKK